MRDVNAQDLEYARKVQEAILPSKEEMRRVLNDFFVLWEPRDTVGGDFYWLKNFVDGYLMVIGDCTGHGVPGLLMTTAVIAMLNHITDNLCHNDPTEILYELDRLINHSFCKGSYEKLISNGLDAGILFVSKDHRIIFSGAKISVFIDDQMGIYEIKGSRDTIDCLHRRREKQFINHEISYTQSMTLYISTDGFTDQPGGARGLPLGKKRLAEILKHTKDLDMEQQGTYVLSSFSEYAGSEMPRDDRTLLGLRLHFN